MDEYLNYKNARIDERSKKQIEIYSRNQAAQSQKMTSNRAKQNQTVLTQLARHQVAIIPAHKKQS